MPPKKSRAKQAVPDQDLTWAQSLDRDYGTTTPPEPEPEVTPAEELQSLDRITGASEVCVFCQREVTDFRLVEIPEMNIRHAICRRCDDAQEGAGAEVHSGVHAGNVP